MEEDLVKNYALCFSYLSLFLMQLIDTAKEADDDRNLVNQKNLLAIFRSLNSFSKYAIEMFVSITQIECLLTPRLSEEFRWGFFVIGLVEKLETLEMTWHRKFTTM